MIYKNKTHYKKVQIKTAREIVLQYALYLSLIRHS